MAGTHLDFHAVDLTRRELKILLGGGGGGGSRTGPRCFITLRPSFTSMTSIDCKTGKLVGGIRKLWQYGLPGQRKQVSPPRAALWSDLRTLRLERPALCRGRAEPTHRQVPHCLWAIGEERALIATLPRTCRARRPRKAIGGGAENRPGNTATRWSLPRQVEGRVSYFFG